MMAVMFYAVFTPIACVFRMIGRDPLERRAHPERQTYWAPKIIPAEPRRYFQQF
jgi:hypothetical protein